MDSYKKINLTKATEYQLGIIFGVGSYIKCESALFFRHKDRYFIEQVGELFNSNIYVQKNKDNYQYCLKTCIADIDSLKSLGWINRNADARHIPILDNYKDFLRAYIELHGYFSYCTSYKGNRKARIKYYRLRLKIYGNLEFMNEINIILAKECYVSEKSVQIMHNKKTASITYSSLEEITNILTYLYGTPNNPKWWKEAKEKLFEPTKEHL